MSSLFIFGMGYSASYFADQALKQGWQVKATCRTPDEKPLWAEKKAFSCLNMMGLNPSE